MMLIVQGDETDFLQFCASDLDHVLLLILLTNGISTRELLQGS